MLFQYIEPLISHSSLCSLSCVHSRSSSTGPLIPFASLAPLNTQRDGGGAESLWAAPRVCGAICQAGSQDTLISAADVSYCGEDKWLGFEDLHSASGEGYWLRMPLFPTTLEPGRGITRRHSTSPPPPSFTSHGSPRAKGQLPFEGKARELVISRAIARVIKRAIHVSSRQETQ